MTGFFVRVMIEGQPRAVEVDRLPDGELERWLGTLGEREARNWLKAMLIWVRENVREGAVGP